NRAGRGDPRGAGYDRLRRPGHRVTQATAPGGSARALREGEWDDFAPRVQVEIGGVGAGRDRLVPQVVIAGGPDDPETPRGASPGGGADQRAGRGVGIV